MSKVIEFVEDKLGIPVPKFLKTLTEFFEDLAVDVLEEVFSWFGIEDEEVLIAFSVSSQIFEVQQRHKDRILKDIKASIAGVCNQPKNLTDQQSLRNAEANAKMYRPYYVALEQPWQGFQVRSNLVVTSINLEILQPAIIADVGIDPIELISAKRQYPELSEEYAYLALKDANVNYIGDGIIQATDDRWIHVIGSTYDELDNEIDATGEMRYTKFTKTVTSVTTSIDAGAGETTVTTNIVVSIATQYENKSKSGYSVESNNTTNIVRPILPDDVDGTVVDTAETTAIHTTSVSIVSYTAPPLSRYITSYFRGPNTRIYVAVTDVSDVGNDVYETTSTENLEMMPLIRLRDNFKNINGISDATYEAASAAQAADSCTPITTGPHTTFLPCAMPTSPRPNKPDPADYGSGEADPAYKSAYNFYSRYISTAAVLRTLGMSVDIAVYMVCGGYTGTTDEDKLSDVTGGYIRFAINPLAQRVKQGVNKKLEDAAAAEKESVPAVISATFDFFKIIADAGAFSVKELYPITEQKAPSGSGNNNNDNGIMLIFDADTPSSYYVHFTAYGHEGYLQVDGAWVTVTGYLIGSAFISSTTNRNDKVTIETIGNAYYAFQSALTLEDGTTQTVGSFNSALTMSNLEDTYTRVLAPIGKESMSISSGGQLLRIRRQINKTTQRQITVRKLKGLTVIKRERDQTDGDILVGIAESSLAGGDETPLLLPVSLAFSKEISADNKLELYYSTVQLELYTSSIIFTEWYKTEGFMDFIKVVVVIIAIIIAVVSWGSLTAVSIALVVGVAAAAGGQVYANYMKKQRDAANAQLESDMKDAARRLKEDMEGDNASELMKDMVLGLTDMVQLLLQDVDTNLTMDYNKVLEIGQGNLQYNNDILYREKYDIYCKSESKIKFKM